jgi:hypothetical protein
MLDPFCIGSSLFSGGNSVVDSFAASMASCHWQGANDADWVNGPNRGGEQIMAISTSGSMTMSGKAISVYDPKPDGL